MKDKRIKQEEAETRQERYSTLTIEQRISVLDKRLGVGIGAKKERDNLDKLLKKAKSEV